MAETSKPIDMLLWCAECHMQHVDAPDERTEGWDNPPHGSHQCHRCGTIWRPADVATNGVRSIATRGRADTWPASRPARAKPVKYCNDNRARRVSDCLHCGDECRG
jgi:hypothetical protein